MSVWYEHKAIIDTRDADGFGRCRPSALLGHLQEAATLAAESRGFGRRVLMDGYGAFWMLARLWYRLDRPLLWGQEVSIHTWHRGGRGASMYRDFDLYVNGEKVGQAVSVWALVSLAERKMLRLSKIPELEGTDGGERNKDIVLSALRLPEELVLAETRLMHYSDTDINAHVNNTKYADFACDAIHAERLPKERFVSGMQLGYHAECHPGEMIDLLTAPADEGCFVCGMDELGKTRFDAQVFIGQDIS